MDVVRHRRHFLLLFLLLASANAVCAAEKPNILFIFADDYAYDCVRALGNEEIETPHIDGLVNRGLTFTHAYNQGGYHGAVCVASRSMLLTGRFLWNIQKEEPTIKTTFLKEERLWPQLLAKQGYATYFTGKWHVQVDADKAFQVARHVRPGMPNQTPEGYHRPVEGQDDVWKPWDRSREGFWKGGRHWSEVVADDALDFLGRAAREDDPFFMYVAFNAPHDPRQSPKRYVDRYPLDKIGVPQPFYPEYPLDIGIRDIRDEVLAPYPRTEHAVKVHRQEYYAIISHLDAQIGRILDGLRASGKTSNTYIVFTADHGLACGHHGLLGKQNMYDHSMRVPFVVVGPEIPNGASNSSPIYLQDIMPTSLEWAGARIPEQVQFHSLKPVIEGRSDRHAYDTIYGGYTNTQRMLVDGEYKLIVYPRIGRKRLYHLAEDPLETKDLSADPAQADRIDAMVEKLEAWQEPTGDTLELDSHSGTASE